MNWLSFSFKISQEQQEILLALLDSIGFEGFEQREEELLAFIPREKFSEEDFRNVINQFPVSFEKKTVAEKNWNSSWEKNFEPIIIENKISVRASFHQPIKNVRHEIIIDPKMAFGTGHHATTEMMMRLMLGENFSGKEILDFGCGTGILSILASEVGGKSVLAIDNDPKAIENAKENFLLNSIQNATALLTDAVPSHKRFDIVLANITREIIIQLLPDFYQASNNSGKLLISGFLIKDEAVVKSAATFHNFFWKKQMISGDWLSAMLVKI